MGMNISEWIEAGSEVLSDVDPGEELAAVAVNELLRKFGVNAVVAALADAAAAAYDHAEETDDESAAAEDLQSELDDVRGYLRMVADMLLAVAS